MMKLAGVSFPPSLFAGVGFPSFLFASDPPSWRKQAAYATAA